MSVMRKKIAEHMAMSIQTSAHVYSVYDVNFHRIEQLRQAKKAEYERAGARLTYTAFIAKATIDTIRRVPVRERLARWRQRRLQTRHQPRHRRRARGGIDCPGDQGGGRTQHARLVEGHPGSRAAGAYRSSSKPEEVQGGTFTITNPGIFGALFGLPIINQPQVAILGVGAIEKRVVVVDDMIAIRPMCYLALGHDHRLIDGADAGRFLQALKDNLENFDESCL